MSIFIPKLSTQAGACLTMENWQEAGVTHVAYSLPALLIKPGLDVLKQCSDLRTYVGWTKQLVLNASALSINTHGKCRIRSTYDGGYLTFDFADLISLMVQLAPQYVLLPNEFPLHQLALLSQFPKDTTLFVSVSAPIPWDEYPHWGVYVDESVSDLAQLTECLQPFHPRLKYVMGMHPVAFYAAMSALNISFVESDKPAADAFDGQVYVSNGLVSLVDSSQNTLFDAIDEQCECPVCVQRLTRAYLSHLYAHTPLLCQRFLIQHNVFQTCHLPSQQIPL